MHLAGLAAAEPGADADAARIIADLVALLDLDPVGDDVFRSLPSAKPGIRIFGGQAVAQALLAASRTVGADRTAHSLHGYFLRAGNPALPIDYAVERDRDGGSFSSRRVVARQSGVPIFSLSASFHVAEEGFEHQPAMPGVPPADGLKSETAIRQEQVADVPNRRGFLLRDIPIELRPVRPRRFARPEKSAPQQEYWFRPVAPLPGDADLRLAFLAYASDFMLLSTALLPHGVHWSTSDIQNASLDHSMWLHRPPRFDDWMLYVQETPWAGGARGLVRGAIYDVAGQLIASVAQEGLLRPRFER